MWRDIEQKVKDVAQELIDEKNAKEMRNRTRGLYNNMHPFLEEKTPGSTKGGHFTAMLHGLGHAQPFYFSDDAPWPNLGYFVSVGKLHLTVLRMQALHYKDIYGADDDSAAEHLKDLINTVDKYMAALERPRPTAWHGAMVSAPWMLSTSRNTSAPQVFPRTCVIPCAVSTRTCSGAGAADR